MSCHGRIKSIARTMTSCWRIRYPDHCPIPSAGRTTDVRKRSAPETFRLGPRGRGPERGRGALRARPRGSAIWEGADGERKRAAAPGSLPFCTSGHYDRAAHTYGKSYPSLLAATCEPVVGRRFNDEGIDSFQRTARRTCPLAQARAHDGGRSDCCKRTGQGLTRSAANSGSRSFRLLAKRYSIATLWPSTKQLGM